jgi:hypothetical protein
MLKNVLNENLRLSADPMSYGLVAKQRIEKFDEVMVLSENYYIQSIMSEASYKAGYSMDLT